MKRVCRAAMVVAVLSCSTYTFAQEAAPSVDDVRAAEEDFNQGREAYKAENFVEAAEFFESADAHAPNPRVLELAMAARNQAGHLDRAATHAQLVMERYPDNERLVELAQPILEKAKPETLALTVECDEPCNLLDGTRIIPGNAATERVVYLTPGAHTIHASWSEGRSRSEEVSGEAGEEKSVSFTAPEIPEPEPEPTPTAPGPVGPVDRGPVAEPTGLPPVVFIVGAGLTAATAGVSTWSAIDTLNNPGTAKVEEQCRGQGVSCPLFQEGQDKELRTNILWGATGALGAATLVVGAFFTDWSGGSPDTDDESDEADSASVRPWVGFGRGATLGATGKF